MNANRLLGRIKESKLTLAEAAKRIGISLSAFRRKIAGDSEFTREEINSLTDVLSLSNDDLLDIFFDK